MTNLTPSEDRVLKTDAKGRVQTPPTRRESLLDEFERSGLSGKKFAALTGVKYQTFANWAQKRRQERGLTASTTAKPGPAVHWLETVVAQAGQGASAVMVQWRSGARLEISHRQQIELAAALLQALEKPAPSC